MFVKDYNEKVLIYLISLRKYY